MGRNDDIDNGGISNDSITNCINNCSNNCSKRVLHGRGLPRGIGTLHRADGTVREGEWRDGRLVAARDGRHGPGSKLSPDGEGRERRVNVRAVGGGTKSARGDGTAGVEVGAGRGAKKSLRSIGTSGATRSRRGRVARPRRKNRGRRSRRSLR